MCCHSSQNCNYTVHSILHAILYGLRYTVANNPLWGLRNDWRTKISKIKNQKSFSFVLFSGFRFVRFNAQTHGDKRWEVRGDRRQEVGDER